MSGKSVQVLDPATADVARMAAPVKNTTDVESARATVKVGVIG